MSRNTLYVANFPPSLTEDDLSALFGQHGEVVSIHIAVEHKIHEPYALVQMAVEKQATQALNALNGHAIEERLLAVSLPEFDPKRQLVQKQRKAIAEIAEQLGESDHDALRQLESIVLLCGVAFAQVILRDAKRVEEAGGLMTSDGTRRRTLGGVFFYLARFRMAPALRSIVYNRKGRLPNPQAADVETTDAPESVPAE